MKPRLKRIGIGAAGGAGLLLIFWLLGDVAHIIGLSLQDSSFFLGLVLFLLGLLMITRGGKGRILSIPASPGKRNPSKQEMQRKCVPLPLSALVRAC